MAAHKDFLWLSEEITYGLYLSDHSILGPVETEIVVLSGIMMQNLPRETGWHLRGTRRIGVRFEDVEKLQQCVSTYLYLLIRWGWDLEGEKILIIRDRLKRSRLSVG